MFGYNLIDTVDKIQRIIVANKRLQLTFTRHVDGNPKIIKKGQSIGPIPPGAME